MEGILSPKQEDRLKGLIGIRDCTRTLIQQQHDDTKEYDIEVQQSLLNALYDGFVAKHGRMCAASCRCAMDTFRGGTYVAVHPSKTQ